LQTAVVRDPREGIDSAGHIRTGAHRSRVPAPYEPVLAALALVSAAAPGPVSVYLYGSVATGAARPPTSDVDAVTVGWSAAEAATVSKQLTDQFVNLCRGVEISVSQPEHYAAPGDAAYGGRAFLRHYCVHLTGPDLTTGWPPFLADARAARGFNGDLAEHHRRWVSDLDAIDRTTVDVGPTEDAVRALARRVARKTLLAVSGLVSVRDRTWTTDRVGAAERWGRLHPPLAAGLTELVAWAESARPVRRDEVRRSLQPGGTVHQLVTAFDVEIGMWS
jgi:hypothetical protein